MSDGPEDDAARRAILAELARERSALLDRLFYVAAVALLALPIVVDSCANGCR